MKLTKKDKTILNNYLALFPEQEEAWNIHELQGFFFGLAMIPEPIMPSEWIQELQMGYELEYTSDKQALETHRCLMNLYNRHITEFETGKLRYPFKEQHLAEDELIEVTEWVSGLVFALSLREEYWIGEIVPPNVSADLADEASFAYLMVNAILSPEYADEILNVMSEAQLAEIDVLIPGETVDNDLKLLTLCLAALGQNVNILIEFATALDNSRKGGEQLGLFPEVPVKQDKVGRNQPCPCGSGKKYKKCCLVKQREKQNDNITHVDFNSGKVLTKPSRAKKTLPAYQLKIGLKWAKPPIWRRVQVPGNLCLGELHDIIQIIMGWTDCHMHHFEIDKIFYEPPNNEDDFRFDSSIIQRDETRFTIHNVLGERIKRFHYIYDFGDDWVHQIDVEKIIPATEAETHPVLLTGRRACPPEDCGGIYGYMQLLEDLADQKSEYHKELFDIFGNFDPAQFNKENIAEIQEMLVKLFT